MNNKLAKSGFSLTEVLLAVATLAIGMLFIAGTFLAGIYLTAVAAERTTAAVVADEAFAKIRLYAVGDPANPADDIDLSRLRTNGFLDFTQAFGSAVYIDPNEFAYPSDNNATSVKQYYWTALCRRIDPNALSRLVQVTVFVTRKTASAASYQGAERPTPMVVSISATPGTNVLTQRYGPNLTWINDGCTIMDNRTGEIYRVLQRRDNVPALGPPPVGPTIELDRPWEGAPGAVVWVVPPPIGSGKDPCIAIYQKVMRF